MRGEVAARKLHSSLALEGFPFPYLLSDICNFLKIELRFASLGDCGGCYLHNGQGRALILINMEHSYYRQRFSLAHELGHAVLRHPPISFLDDAMGNNYGDKIREAEANAFAAELLMPKRVLCGNGHMTPQAISEYCRVSLDAATIRAKKLGWVE